MSRDAKTPDGAFLVIKPKRRKKLTRREFLNSRHIGMLITADEIAFLIQHHTELGNIDEPGDLDVPKK